MSKKLFFAILLAACSSYLWTGCGNEGVSPSGSGGGGSGSGTSLSGTVSVPSETTTSVSLGLSASKGTDSSSSFSVSKSDSANSDSASPVAAQEQVIVSKATTDAAASDCTIKVLLLDGTVLDTCVCDRVGGFSGCDIDCGKLDATKQVEVIATSGSKKVTSICDASSCSTGGTITCGTVNADTTLSTQTAFSGIDPNAGPESVTDAVKTALANGTWNPLQLFKTANASLGLSGLTVGADSAQNAMFAMNKGVKACIAKGSISLSEIPSCMSGGASCLSKIQGCDSSLAAIDMSSAATLAKNYASATGKYFADSTTAGKVTSSAMFEALAKNFGAYNSTAQFQSVISNPGNCRSLLNPYFDDIRNGVSGAAAKLGAAGRSMGNFFANFGSGTDLGSSRGSACKAIFDNLTFTDSSTFANLGASVAAQCKAADSAAKITNLLNNPAQYAATMMKDPTALANDDGTIAGGWINQLGAGGSLTSLTPCNPSSPNCPSGQTCSTTSHFCGASVAGLGTGTGIFGATCSANADCQSNTCTSSRCDFPSGGFGFITGLKFFGVACANTAECIGGLTCAGTPSTCGGGGGGGGGGSSTLYFAYVVNTLSNNLSAFSINATTGALTALTGSPFTTGTAPNDVAISPNGKCLFVPNGTTNNTSVFSVAPTTGILTAGTTISHGPGTGPLGAVVSSSSDFAYIVLSGTAKVAVYSINATTCALTAINGGSPNHLYSTGNSPQKVAILNTPNSVRLLFTTNAGSSDAISRFSVNIATGALTSLGANTSTGGDNPFGIASDANGKFLYASNATATTLSGFTIDATSGALTAVSGSPYSDGSFGNGVAVIPNGTFLYGAKASNGTVCGFSVNATTGVLTYLGDGSCASMGVGGVGGGGVMADPTNKFLYAAHSGNNIVSAFSVNATTGALTSIANYTVGTTPGAVRVIGITQ